MGLVEEHLGKIEDSLGKIETKLNQGIRAEKKMGKLRETDEDKRREMAERAIKAAKDLVKACKIYFDLAKMPERQQEKAETVKPELFDLEHR